MKVVLLILVAMVAACQSAAIDNFEIDEYDPDEELDKPTGLQWGTKREAFMAYLGECQNLGRNQHIKFDKVLLNDGNRYNPHTGVFTPKYSGVYSFSYSVAQKSKRPLSVKLMVDGHNIDGAVVPEGKQHGGCHCSRPIHMGGNTAVIHVCKGHSVYVVAADAGHVEGSETERYTTFTGHLLYTRK